MFQALVLGVVQGLAEFLPISSSGHLVLVRWLLDWPDQGLFFDVALHMGTLVALLLVFWPDWLRLIKAGFSRANSVERRLFWTLALASIPGGIAGALLEKKAETAFRHPVPIAIALIVFGLLLLGAERWQGRVKQPGVSQGLWIGLAQAIAVVPGVSRSGITLTAGMALGLEREVAARFSFLLATPIIAGAGLKTLLDLHSAGTSLPAGPTVTGFLAAAVSGYLVIRWFLTYINQHSVRIFTWYRVLFGLLVIAVALQRG